MFWRKYERKLITFKTREISRIFVKHNGARGISKILTLHFQINEHVRLIFLKSKIHSAYYEVYILGHIFCGPSLNVNFINPASILSCYK